MANNRMYLVCNICNSENPDVGFFAIAKYFPSSGWYSIREDNKSLNEWLETHTHLDKMNDPHYGDNIIRFEYENEAS